MISARFAPIVFGFILSIIMSGIITGVSSGLLVEGWAEFVAVWPKAWFASWLIAFPSLLIFAPLVRRFVGRLTRPPA